MKIDLWIEAARPKTLIASIAPVVIGSFIAKEAGNFQFFTFLAALLTGIFLQIGTNLSNDYFDAKKGSDTLSRIGPRRVMQAGLVDDMTMKRAIFVTFLLAAFSCLYLIAQGGALIGYLLILAILLGLGYTAGPFALAYIGLGDICVLLFFGPLAAGMTAYLHTGKFLPLAFLAGIAPGAISTAILTINNLRDQKTDAIASKKTLIVRFGALFGKWQYTILLTLPFLLPFTLKIGLLAMPLALFALLLVREVWQAKIAEDYLPLLPKTSFLLGAYTLLFILI